MEEEGGFGDVELVVVASGGWTPLAMEAAQWETLVARVTREFFHAKVFFVDLF